MFEKIKKKLEFKKLQKKSMYTIGKMKEHINDADSTEFKKWACLNCIYLTLMEQNILQRQGKV